MTKTQKLGVLFNTDRLDHKAFISYAMRIDELGFESLWLPELFTRDPFAAAGFLLAQTKQVKLATGIANIYARDPAASVSLTSTLQGLSQGRFILGLGVSNATLNAARGHDWQPPVTKLRSYLQDMQRVKLSVERVDAPIHVAAHGPKMLQVAAQHADGANTYIMPQAHVTEARNILGSTADLNTMLFCLHETDPEQARQTCRRALAYYIGLDYYHRAWRNFGFEDADFENGGSNRLIDELVAWGDIDAIKQRIGAQFTLGASRVVIIPLGTGLGGQPDWQLLNAVV